MSLSCSHRPSGEALWALLLLKSCFVASQFSSGRVGRAELAGSAKGVSRCRKSLTDGKGAMRSRASDFHL